MTLTDGTALEGEMLVGTSLVDGVLLKVGSKEGSNEFEGLAVVVGFRLLVGTNVGSLLNEGAGVWLGKSLGAGLGVGKSVGGVDGRGLDDWPELGESVSVGSKVRLG